MNSASADAQQQLEDYVRSRITAFAMLFAAEVAPDLSAGQVKQITERLLVGNDAAVASSSEVAGAQQGNSTPSATDPPPKLVYTHDCRAFGCRDVECLMCQYNPERVCERNFQKKYLVGDLLKAKCGAPVRVELVGSSGNLLTDTNYSNMEFELNIIDGNAFRERGGEVQQLSDRELRGCIKYTKKDKAEPLLCYKSAPAAIQRIVVRLVDGVGILPELTVTESSEALLAGRRPPFRLITWMSDAYGLLSSEVQYGTSNEFVVATRRVRQANKVEIPLMDDPVSKVEHIGRETMKKLADLRIAALENGVPEVAAALDENTARIETVGQFQRLLRMADTDTQLRKNLQMILKLPRDKWEETATHAMSAVVPDFRRRVWYPPGHSVGLGLVFGCKYGAPQMNMSVSLAQTMHDGNIKVIAEDQLDHASLDILRELKATAVKRWTEPHHPGWGIFRDTAAESAAAAAAAAGPFSVAQDAAAAAVNAAAAAGSRSRLPNSSSFGRRTSSSALDPAAAALPVATDSGLTDLAAAQAGPSRAGSGSALLPAAAAARGSRSGLPVGAKRTADAAGLDVIAAAAAAIHNRSSRTKTEARSSAAAGVAAKPAAAYVQKQLLPSASAAAAAVAAANNAAAAAATNLQLPPLSSDLSSSSPLRSNAAAAAMIQAAAAAMAAAQAAGAPAHEVMAYFTRAITAGFGTAGTNTKSNGVVIKPPVVNGVTSVNQSQKDMLHLPRVLTMDDVGLRGGMHVSDSGRNFDVNKLTGLDAVAAAAEAAEAAEKLEQQPRQQQQRWSEGQCGTDLSSGNLLPSAIAAILDRLAGNGIAALAPAAAAAADDGNLGDLIRGYAAAMQGQQQVPQQQQQSGDCAHDGSASEQNNQGPEPSLSNRSTGTAAAAAAAGPAGAGSSKHDVIIEMGALAAASLKHLAHPSAS